MTRQEVVPERLAGATAVVLDVFMATTTLLTILENGARGVYPARSLEEADRVRERLDSENVLRGGEQDAARIDGYDHGPFPEEYAPDIVNDRDVIFVTTNGTRAIADVSGADRVLLGCLRNAPSVAHELATSDSVYLVCAGSAGRFSLEDFIGAATIMSCMDTEGWHLNDGAWMARDFVGRHAGMTTETLRRSRAGRYFVENDMTDVLDFVADVGASDLVPEMRAGRLVDATAGRRQQKPKAAVRRRAERREAPG